MEILTGLGISFGIYFGYVGMKLFMAKRRFSANYQKELEDVLNKDEYKPRGRFE